MKEAFADAMRELVPSQGIVRTVLDGVALFRAESRVPRTPLLYDQCVCFLAGGSKTGHLADRSLTWDAGHFLVVPTLIPFECETVATPRAPLLGVGISIDYVMVQEIVAQLGERYGDVSMAMAPHPGAYLEPVTDEVLEPVVRLARSLRTEGEARMLGRQIVREIFYRVLLCGSGHILASAAHGGSVYARISKALRTIHAEYGQALSVERLADTADMSVRSFHAHFKAATSYTPVQYVKRIRLEKARQVLAGQGLQASVTAHMVGYESPSQFSREFKRHFGYPPSEARQHDGPHMVG